MDEKGARIHGAAETTTGLVLTLLLVLFGDVAAPPRAAAHAPRRAAGVFWEGASLVLTHVAEPGTESRCQ